MLITGVPGSGKTTLGTELAGALQIPFLARDAVRRGLFLTDGGWTDRPERVPTSTDSVEVFLRLVERMASLGVSCIVEFVVSPDRSDELRRLTAAGDCVVLRTECRDPLRRFERRNRRDRLLNRAPVLDALGYASIDDHTTDSLARMRFVAEEMQTEFDLPLLPVRTDDGYDPGLDELVEFVVTATPSD